MDGNIFLLLSKLRKPGKCTSEYAVAYLFPSKDGRFLGVILAPSTVSFGIRIFKVQLEPHCGTWQNRGKSNMPFTNTSHGWFNQLKIPLQGQLTYQLIFLLTLCWVIYTVNLTIHFNCNQKGKQKRLSLLNPNLLNTLKWSVSCNNTDLLSYTSFQFIFIHSRFGE